MTRHRLSMLALATLPLLLPLLFGEAAQAHAGHDGHAGPWSGLLHPLVEPDHLLAMLAVGLLSLLLPGAGGPVARFTRRLPLLLVAAATGFWLLAA